MIILLSPAKSLIEKKENYSFQASKPQLIKETLKLHKHILKLNIGTLQKTLKVSDKLAKLNYQRFQDFNSNLTKTNSKPAILSFNGGVYKPIKFKDYNKLQQNRANKTIRILSGFYGILRPYDLIMPYRLEMGTKLESKEAKNLYEFWGHKLTDSLNNELKKKSLVVNLASKEYFKAIKPKLLKVPIVNIDFKDYHNGTFKIIGIKAKKARGQLTDFIIKNNCKTVENIKDFNIEGYKFSKKDSTENNLVFLRR